MNDKVVIITGGSKGIGQELVQLYDKEGFQVVSISRSFNTYQSERVHKIKCDISQYDEVVKAVDEIIRKFGKIDILINNAGMGISGAVEHTTQEDINKIVDVNFYGTSNFIQASLSYIRESQGKIVNMSSLAAVIPIPYQSYYCATKAAINLLGDSLRNELRAFNVQIMTVMPGDVSTTFTDNRVKAKETGNYQDFVDKSVAVMEKDERGGMSASYAAKKIAKAINKKRMPIHLIVGADYKFLYFATKVVPKRLLSWILFKLYGGLQ